MSDFVIWSAPEEPYTEHIKKTIEEWRKIKDRMLPILCRLFSSNKYSINDFVEFLIVCHDIGKLTYHWQQYIHKPTSERKFGPPHATLGASYLILSKDGSDLSNASALAILMHHIDSGLAQGNLEHPAEDAINRGLVDYRTDAIQWADGAEDTFKETVEILSNVVALNPLSSVTLQSLEEMALKLRGWSRCPKEIERHKHRLQALSIHHILKVCDWRAASQRSQQEDEEGETIDKDKIHWKESILKVYLECGLLP